jgi:hypothetical protein
VVLIPASALLLLLLLLLLLSTTLSGADATEDVPVDLLSTEAATAVSTAADAGTSTSDVTTAATTAGLTAATAAAATDVREHSVSGVPAATGTAQQQRAVKSCSIGSAVRSARLLQPTTSAPVFTVGAASHAAVHKADLKLRVGCSGVAAVSADGGVARNPFALCAADTVGEVGAVSCVEKAWGWPGMHTLTDTNIAL